MKPSFMWFWMFCLNSMLSSNENLAEAFPEDSSSSCLSQCAEGCPSFFLPYTWLCACFLETPRNTKLLKMYPAKC